MAASSVSAVSTYNGRGFSFASTVASKVLDAAKAAKDVKHEHDSRERRGETIPEAEKKGVFARALKEQFVDNPIKGLKKSLGVKVAGGAGLVGLFGKKGRATERKILATNKKYFGVRKKRGGGRPMGGGSSPTSSGGSGNPSIDAFGSLTLDIEQIANSISNLTGLFNTNLGLTYKISGGLAEIKNILTDQLSVQKSSIEDDKMRAKEASLENSQQNSGSDKATSTMTGGGGPLDMLMNLLNIPKALQSLTGFLSRIPAIIKGLIGKLPGGQMLLKGASKVIGGASGLFSGAAGFMKGGFMKFLRPVFKRIPVFGGLLDFAISLALGEPIGRAAAKAVGLTLGAGLGSLIPIPGVGTIAGGVLGDWVGGTLYDAIAGKPNPEQKMSEGGVMVGEAGPEMITSLDSAMGKSAFSGGGPLEDAYQQPYNAVAGGMLAVTKDFVEGLGPIGSSVSPVIQDDIDKLGKVFDIPATSTNIQVGGPSLKSNPLAEKEGKKYMEDLIQGSLEKIAPKKESNAGGSSGGSTTAAVEKSTTGADASAGSPAGSTPAPAAPPQKTTLESLKENTNFVNRRTEGGDVINAVSGTNKAGVRKVKMADDNGKLSDKYYYDAVGEIFSVDPALGAKGISKLSSDQIKAGLGNSGRFYRNLQTGQVVVTNRPPVGFYNYEKNGIVRADKATAASNAVNMTYTSVKTTPIESLSDIEKQNFGGFYGPKADISKIKAESGIKAVLTLGGSRRSNLPVSSFAGTHPHHGTGRDEGDGHGGFKRDYLIQKSGASDGVLAGPSHKGAPVPAGMDGYAEVKGDSLNSVVIWDKPQSDVTRKMKARFLHFDTVRVKTGDRVSPGTILGGQGNKPNYDAYHVHLEASDKDQDRWIKTVNAMISGGQLPSDAGAAPDDPEVDSESNDPMERMRNAIISMTSGLGMMSELQSGRIKNKADYDTAKSQISAAVKSSVASSDKATNPAHFRGGPSGGAPSAPALPASRASAPTAATSTPSGRSPAASVAPVVSQQPQSPQVVQMPSSQPQGQVGLASSPSAPSSSTAISFLPHTQLVHLGI
jgi:hypothetical protein